MHRPDLIYVRTLLRLVVGTFVQSHALDGHQQHVSLKWSLNCADLKQPASGHSLATFSRLQ